MSTTDPQENEKEAGERQVGAPASCGLCGHIRAEHGASGKCHHASLPGDDGEYMVCPCPGERTDRTGPPMTSPLTPARLAELRATAKRWLSGYSPQSPGSPAIPADMRPIDTCDELAGAVIALLDRIEALEKVAAIAEHARHCDAAWEGEIPPIGKCTCGLTEGREAAGL